MLDPKNNRLDYGEQLIPPEDYELVQAIGTTYSLDLEVLMVIPVALFYSQKLDGDIEKLRYDILDAITKSSEKIKIYYQKGQMKVPNKYNSLMAYWENGLEAVSMPDYVSSFHPKTWIIRYESKDKPVIYRLIVTSRNLTFARDYDIGFATDGVVTKTEQPEAEPLINFLKFLNVSGKQNISDNFIRDLFKVKFDLPKNFISLNLVPIGIKNHENDNKCLYSLTQDGAQWDEILIISPFLDEKMLNKLQKSAEKTILMSRKEEMDNISIDSLNRSDCWQFSKLIERAEFSQELSEDEVSPLEQSLHAKIYIAMKDKIPYWFFGSANCSDAANSRNIEFMIEAVGANTAGLRAKDVFKTLTGQAEKGSNSLFVPYDFNARNNISELKKIDSVLRKIKYDLSMLLLKGRVELIKGGSAYNLLIEIDANKLDLEEGFKVKLRPLPEKNKLPVLLNEGSYNLINEFTGYQETELSRFLEFKIFNGSEIANSFLLPMDIELPETRLNKIISSIINSKDKFLKYLAFLLTGEEIELINNNETQDAHNEKNYTEWSISGTPVFEKLLIAASRYPGKLISINKLIKSLKEEALSKEHIITPEFEKFWQIFQNFIKKDDIN